MSEMVLIQISRNEWDSLVEMVKTMQKPGEVKHKAAEIIDRKELCKRLGITQQTAINWEKRNKVPVLRQGSVIRYDWEAVQNALITK